MALSIIGTPAAAGASSITFPTHAAGDIVVIGAYNSTNTTAPSPPAAGGTVPTFIDIDANTGANGNALRTVYFVATANNHTSGFWSNIDQISAIVIRGQAASPIGGHAESGGTTGTSAVAPSITMSVTDGSSMLLHFFGGVQINSSWAAAPAGYTKQTSNSFVSGICLDTKDSTTSDGSVSQATLNNNTAYRGGTVEILALGAANTTNFFAMF